MVNETKDKLKAIINEYIINNEDVDGFVSDFMIYFILQDEDTIHDIFDDWYNDLQS